MGNIQELVRDLEKLPVRMKKASQAVLNKESRKLVIEFQQRSPVATGQYKAGWMSFIPRFNSSGIYASIGIKNEDPKAYMMDQGADIDSSPWYFPKSKSRSGKLVESGGKIWAGGLKPGHSMTIGGAIDPVLFNNSNRQLQIAKSIADSVIRVI